jgi:hypothetical protein
VIAQVLNHNGAWIQFHKVYADDFIPLPHDPRQLAVALKSIEKRGRELLADLSRHRELHFLSAAEAESIEVQRRSTVSPNDRVAMLIRETRDRTLVLIGGSHSHLSDNTDYDECRFHAFGECSATGDAVEPAIFRPSLDPRAYFPSGSPYHCAHKAVHTQRQDRCVISRFEQHLCCRKCILFERCWPDGGASLPCRKD